MDGSIDVHQIFSKMSNIMNPTKRLVVLILLLVFSMPLASEQPNSEIRADYSPGVGRDHPTKLLWGDTHLHSNLSTDAYTFGNRNLSPDDAFRYAKGEKVIASNGLPSQLTRPLDFLAVTDHAAFMGIFLGLDTNDRKVMRSKLGRRWGAYIKNDERGKLVTEFANTVSGIPVEGAKIEVDEKVIRSFWGKSVDIAERHNQPGVFTTLHGYEWTSITEGNNLHRVVLFKDDADKVSKLQPFSALDSSDPEDLWEALDSYRQKNDGTVMTIPHNGNLSNGIMFDQKRLNGKPLTKSYADKRAFYERIYEVTQVKGDSEAHPLLSPDDQFADYYNWDEGNVGRTAPKTPAMLAGEYARPALTRGLGLEQALGTNPYKFGLIGSTDNHTGLAANEENNFFGKFGDSEPSTARATNTMGNLDHLWENSLLAASGYAAVWADSNTREGIYSALHRREVYATTGSRIYLRYFAGADFTAEDLSRPDPVPNMYKKGVPMGGDLSAATMRGKSPVILVNAAKDPNGANLARVQIIKGWWSKEGQPKEKIYDLEVAYDEATPHTVVGASYSNSIGVPLISGLWQDPDFDPSVAAYYYVRVIEIPSPTWLAYDAAYFKSAPTPGAKLIHQERAYGSPIWYAPN